MFSIANFLDRAKARASIESDYRLAKVIGITHSAMTHYRMGRSLPNESVIEQICALSGDDPDLIAAQIQAARAKDAPAQIMWARIAARLAGGAQTAILSVLIFISLIAVRVEDARASAVANPQSVTLSNLYIVSITILSVLVFLLVRLRQIPVFGLLV